MVSRTKGNPNYLLLVFVVGLGILSAFLVNDTIAILGVPLAIYVMRSVKPIPIVLLFGLAFGISIGSVMTPIGNPQNLLIAIQGGDTTTIHNISHNPDDSNHHKSPTNVRYLESIF
jgi:Na+/H+ antiporter NhaD/arsenite permease-like protein